MRNLNFMDGQLRELLTDYGKLAASGSTGCGTKPDADWHLARTYALIIIAAAAAGRQQSFIRILFLEKTSNV